MIENFQDHLTLQVISYSEALLRLLLAALFGFLLGLDRDKKNKPVDFRVYIIIAMTTTILAIMAQELDYHYTSTDFLKLDLGKIIAGVLTGIGFLGAGAIMKVGDEKVIGTATGASIWASGGMGLCLGFGLYGLAIILFFSLAITLYIAGRLYSKIVEE